MTPEAIKRYARHLVLKEIGGPGQQALGDAKVAIVGAGGLGGPAGLYLAAAGVGHITVIDDDHIETSNLQRQIQFKDQDIGQSKAKVLAKTLSELNPLIATKAHPERLNPDNAMDLLSGHDIILDGVDDFATRFTINKASLALGQPLVSGALGRWQGHVATFPGDGSGPCYQCLVHEIPAQTETCSEVGVIGALAGIIGTHMALETMKLITGAGETLSGSLWIYDGLTAQSRIVTLPRDPKCPACSG